MEYSRYINNLKGHLTTINAHKAEVMRLCFKVGLYKQGLLHDLSKYSPIELMTGAKYYAGYRSPNAIEREELGYSRAWLHHKGRNKHHFEYWIDISGKKGESAFGCEMPVKYVVEMFCDRVAASKVYKKDAYTDSAPLEYYIKNRDHYVMHPKTADMLEKLLICLAKFGEERTLGYIKHKILNKCI